MKEVQQAIRGPQQTSRLYYRNSKMQKKSRDRPHDSVEESPSSRRSERDSAKDAENQLAQDIGNYFPQMACFD
jgi:hypothetical protein